MSAEPVSAGDRVAGEATAEHALAALRRDRLVHSWQRNGTGFAIIVGQGTVRLLGLDPAGVLRLADQLRRDKVTIVGGGYAMGYRTIRYTLSDGRFAARHDSRADRDRDDCPYTVYLPGGAPSGCAAVSFAARTQNDALALAGLARVRGRCTRCHTLRPLHVRGWQPDASIPCPGCGADASTPVALLCRTCQQPIVPTTSPDPWPLRAAWQHAATGTPFCQTGDRPHGFPGDRPQACPR